MKMDVNYDLDMTGVFAVEAHRKNGTVPGTNKPYSCDFDVRNYRKRSSYLFHGIERPSPL
jgi:hypothetical protein